MNMSVQPVNGCTRPHNSATPSRERKLVVPMATTGLPWRLASAMASAVASGISTYSRCMFTAAVADFSPTPFGPRKFKKADAPDGLTVAFTPNPDILRTLSQGRKPGQKVLGFAAETAPDMDAPALRRLAEAGNNAPCELFDGHDIRETTASRIAAAALERSPE